MILDPREKKVIRAILDLKAKQAISVRLAHRVKGANKVLKEKEANKARREILAPKAYLVKKVRKVIRATKAYEDYLVNPARKEKLVRPVPKAKEAPRETHLLMMILLRSN